jgi:hypothetical protein
VNRKTGAAGSGKLDFLSKKIRMSFQFVEKNQNVISIRRKKQNAILIRRKNQNAISICQKKQYGISIRQKNQNAISIRQKNENDISICRKKQYGISICQKNQNAISIRRKSSMAYQLVEKNQNTISIRRKKLHFKSTKCLRRTARTAPGLPNEIFSYRKSQFGYIFELQRKMLVHFMAIYYILFTSLVYFAAFLEFFPFWYVMYIPIKICQPSRKLSSMYQITRGL